jgi:hypothetical protein
MVTGANDSSKFPNSTTISNNTPQPLLPTNGPVQLVPPPDNSIPSASALFDRQVIPAKSNSQAPETFVDLGQQAAARTAAELLESSFSLSPENTEMSSSLNQLLAHCPEGQRTAVTHAYWRLVLALSQSNWAQDEQKRLEQIVPRSAAIDGPILSTARAAATAQVTDSQLEATTTWAALAEATSSFQEPSQGSPLDTPLVAPYNTYYSQLFGNRPNGRAWEIDRALPLRWKTISDRAAAVQSALSAMHSAEQAYGKKEVDLQTVLACHENLHTQRREFLNAVLRYNLDVAEYAAAAAPAGTPPEKFVAMLIRPKTTERLSAVPQRSTFSTAAGPLSSGSSLSKSPPPASNKGRTAKSSGQSHLPANDGWVPSTQRAMEAESPPAIEEQTRAAAPPSGVSPSSPLGPQSDPFAPNVGDRYGNRYNTDGR